MSEPCGTFLGYLHRVIPIRNVRALVGAGVLLCAGSQAAAAPDDAPGATVERSAPARPAPWRRYGMVVLENAIAMAIPGAWYWNDVDFNMMDWELQWDWPSWRMKLLSTDALRFDTNAFYTNAVRHPFAGVIHYQIGRANGFGAAGATAISLITAVAWEYLVEYPEYVSVNDIVMNTAAGLSVGEPLLQIGRYARLERHGPYGDWVGSSLTPIDRLHAWLDGGDRRAAGSWHRVELALGAGASRFGDGEGRQELEVAGDVELVTQPDYLRDGAGSSWAGPGSWNRIAAGARLGEATGTDVPAIQFRSQTLVAGRFYRDLRDVPGGVSGETLLVGVGSAFRYDRRTLAGETDRLAIAHLGGPQLELVIHRGPVSLRWETAAYGDFAMVDAMVFSAMPLPQDPPLTSSLRAQGYYFGAGLTGTTRLRLTAPIGDADLEVRAHQFWSIDGLDRQELNGDTRVDPEGLVDRRLAARLLLQTRPTRSSLTLGTLLEAGVRNGTWEAMSRTRHELGASLRAGVSF